MLHFFRGIRRKLAGENKFIQYSRYAIGEILLVVIGILIALQVNNWNETRKDIKLEKRFLQDLLSDVENDIVNLKVGTVHTGKSSNAKRRLLKYIDGTTLTQDSVFYYMGYVTPFNSFIPTTITIDELKNSYGLEVIRDVSLRRMIVSLYHHYSLVNEFEKDFNNSQERIKTIRIADFPTASSLLFRQGRVDNPEETLNQIKHNMQFKNALATNLAHGRDSLYRETLKRSLELQKVLKQKVDNN